jgi:hypothetical protein
MTIRQVLAWFTKVRRPARAERPTATKRACALCGRVVAHTLGGRPYLHRCRVALLDEGLTQGDTSGEVTS